MRRNWEEQTSHGRRNFQPKLRDGTFLNIAPIQTRHVDPHRFSTEPPSVRLASTKSQPHHNLHKQNIKNPTGGGFLLEMP